MRFVFPSMPRIRVLVADDNPPSAELVRDHLESLGYAVDCAADGNRAVVLGGTGDYELLILDVDIPVYDGVEVLRMLRQRLLLRPIKIIVLTADRLATRRAELSQTGIDAYLTKPVDLERLGRLVEQLLGVSAARSV